MNESNIPKIEQSWLEMRNLRIEPYKIPRVELTLEWTTTMHGPEAPWQKVVPSKLFLINHPVWGSYIPAKVVICNGNITFVYYVNQDLPPETRPFSDGECYAWVVKWDPDMHMRYPVETRVFIDQVIDTVNGDVYTVFITSKQQFDMLTGNVVPERKIELEGDLAVYTDDFASGTTRSHITED
jgi:hypothetical protein